MLPRNSPSPLVTDRHHPPVTNARPVTARMAPPATVSVWTVMARSITHLVNLPGWLPQNLSAGKGRKGEEAMTQKTCQPQILRAQVWLGRLE